MLLSLLEILRCPVTGSRLNLDTYKFVQKEFDGKILDITWSGVLFADNEWFYPVVNGIPRLAVEAVIDHEDFLKLNMPDYSEKIKILLQRNGAVINEALKKNRRTKKSFEQEWAIFDQGNDKTWNAGDDAILQRFLKETNENIENLQSKIIFDAGCGNGKLNLLLGEKAVTNIAMDIGNSIETAYANNKSGHVHFIQGDVQFPPVAKNYFDIVHCSGVLIHTNNTQFSFGRISPLVKAGGKLSVWLYHPAKGFLHNSFNLIRRYTSRLPLKTQYYIYRFTIFPVSFIAKKMKGNTQNNREMMIDILDWFTPEFRWEHTHDEVEEWFEKNNFMDIQITTDELFGFNIIGVKA